MTQFSLKPVFLFTALFLFVAGARANDEVKGSIEGTITTNDNKPAAAVTILLKGTSRAALSDEGGNFVIRGIEPGSYMLQVSLVGYQTLEQSVQIEAAKKTTVSLQLQLSEQQLQEVVVRSNVGYKATNPSSTLRLNSPLIQIPQNIQVVTAQNIKDQQIFDMLEGVTRNVSGVTRVEHWDNYALIYMRGASIAAFRNGMNVTMPWGPLAEDMSMVERVEFVKGPAGFMLANGEPGGFYNIVTKKPSGITKQDVAFTYGSYNTFRATADMDGKLTKNGKLLYRLNLMTQYKGSHRAYEYNKRYSIAPVLRYKIDDKTTLTAEYTYQFSQMSLLGAANVFSPAGYASLPVDFTNAEPNIAPTNIKDHSSFLTFNRQLSASWKLTTQLAYFNYNQVGSDIWYDSLKSNGDLYRRLFLWDAIGTNKVAQLFVNGTVKTGNVTHKILSGIDAGKKQYWADFYQSGALQGPQVFNIYNPVHGIPDNMLPVFDRTKSIKDRANASNSTVNQQYAALYVQDEVQLLNDRLRLTVAGRYTNVKQSDYGTEYKGAKFTPRLGLSYSINKATSAYAVFDQAFVPAAGYDSLKLRSFVPITGNNMELGFKRDWAGGRWNTTASLYQITKNNVATAVSGRPNAQTQLGQTRTRGAELDVRGQLLPGLDLTLNYAFTDAEVSKDNNKAVIGNAVAGSTRHITNGWLSYRLSGGGLKGFGVAAGYQWQIKRSSWYVFDNSEAALPDYFRMDGNISWQNEKVAITLNANNLLNTYLYSGSPYGGDWYWQTEAPRNFRLSVGYSF